MEEAKETAKKGGKGGGKRCIAAGCSNTNVVEGVAVFLWPTKDEGMSGTGR